MKDLLRQISLFSMLFLAGLGSGIYAQTGMKFDGDDDYISVPNASELIAGSPEISLSFWVYPENGATGWPDFDGFAGFRNGFDCDFYVMQIDGTNVEARFRNSAGINFDVTFGGLELDAWNHFVFTYDGAELNLYHNGVNVGTTAASGTIASTTTALEMGRMFYLDDLSSFYLDGKIDHVALWNIAIPTEEVPELYDNICDYDLSSPELLLSYEFTEGIIDGDNTALTAVVDGKENIDGDFVNLALEGVTSNYSLGYAGASASFFEASDCSAYTVPSGDETYTVSGVYTDTLVSVSGCDSIMTINLSINSDASSIEAYLCGSYTVPSGDETYEEEGIYMDTLTNIHGCDSVLTINLVSGVNAASIDAFLCDSYTVPSGDETYVEEGVYMDTLTNVYGCDSILTINLASGVSVSAIDEMACYTYTVPSGDETYEESGVYMDTLTNAVGCDSIITINLTMGNTASSMDAASCFSYTVPSGDETYVESGVYTDTLANAMGCDSIITIDLTINEVDVSVDVDEDTLYAVSEVGSYQWINCATDEPVDGATGASFTPEEDGDYALILTIGECTDTSECFEINLTSAGISKNTLESVSLYPLPVTDNLTVDLGSNVDQINVIVMDISGKILISQTHGTTQKFMIQLNDQPAGLYFIRIATDNTMKTYKVIKK